MEAIEVLEVLDALETAGVATCLDGGWGVDALIGRQTRQHADVDVVITGADRGRAQAALSHLGYRRDHAAVPGLPARLVLRFQPRIIDFHLVFLDERGNGWQELDDHAWGAYPAEGLAGRGLIDGRPVRCVTAELQVRHHLGYPPSDKDRADMRALADAFDVAVPPGWRSQRPSM